MLSDLNILLAIYKDFYLDVAKGCMNGAPRETRTHSWRFYRLMRPSKHPFIRTVEFDYVWKKNKKKNKQTNPLNVSVHQFAYI